MNALVKKIFFINPPGPLYQRGEDRSQGNIEQSSATSLRAPNDLAYMAAVARLSGIECRIKDYPPEKGDWDDFSDDLMAYRPDLLIMSVTNATILKDMKAFEMAKAHNPDIITLAKGAFFFSVPMEALNRPEFINMDYAIFGEAETVIGEFLKKIHIQSSVQEIPGLIYRGPNKAFIRNKPAAFIAHLDAIPFPARDLLNNRLYIRPDTGEPQATIQTSRGCPHRCIYCLTPIISGKTLRRRSADNICNEIEECIRRHGITNFFFKADTFTLNKNDVIDLCREIIHRNLTIRWVANSRVDTLDEEGLGWMRRAGCWLVALGIESGDPDSLLRMKKGATVEQARNAVRLAQSAGLQVYGFFMIGFPWDTEQTIRSTFDFAAELECDFYEIHIAVPYEGTELYDLAQSMNVMESEVIGHDYFNDPVMRTVRLSRSDLLRLRQKGLRRLLANPKYIIKTLKKTRNAAQLLNYGRYGFRYLKNIVKAP